MAEHQAVDHFLGGEEGKVARQEVLVYHDTTCAKGKVVRQEQVVRYIGYEAEVVEQVRAHCDPAVGLAANLNGGLKVRSQNSCHLLFRSLGHPPIVDAKRLTPNLSLNIQRLSALPTVGDPGD
jgi:hypothetical protein